MELEKRLGALTESKSTQPLFIFDMGGVVTKWKNNDPLVKFVADRYEVPFGRMKQVMEEGLVEFESGGLSSHDYIATCLRRVGKKMKKGDDADWLLTFPIQRLARLRRGTVEIIRLLRHRGYRVYALSNTSPPHVEMGRRLGWDTLFDGLFASCEIGAVKPSRRAYQHVLKQVGAPPNQAVFIDDNEANVVGAVRVGIKRSFQFRSVLQLRRDIAGILRET
ncbi:MAG: HAD family phosphatase [Nitrososphaerales archaeon]|nr:HAD family phosphatase [Nitrososphaerales archaeon]